MEFCSCCLQAAAGCPGAKPQKQLFRGFFFVLFFLSRKILKTFSAYLVILRSAALKFFFGRCEPRIAL